MTEHELQSWLKQIADTEAHFWTYLDNAPPLDDTFGWGARLEHMWRKEPNRPCGLLLTGPNGCGKHTAATHMFRILSDDYYIVLMNGIALCEGGFDNANARLLGTIKSYGKENKPMCLILDGLEDCSFRKELFSSLGQALTITWLSNPSLPPVFVILIDAHEEDIPAILRSRLRLCRMSLPTASRRRAYLERSEFPLIQIAVNPALLVDATEGITYAQLADLAQNLEATLHCLPKNQLAFTDEELLEFLQEQLPSPARQDPLQSLAQSARQFIENFPDLIARMGSVLPAPVPNPVSIPDPTPQPTPVSTSEPPLPNKQDFKQEINDMPVKDLCTDLLGKDRLDQMRAKYSNRQRA